MGLKSTEQEVTWCAMLVSRPRYTKKLSLAGSFVGKTIIIANIF